MNKTDQFGRKVGYWEEHIGGSIHKGNYYESKKDGVWRSYDEKKLRTITSYNIILGYQYNTAFFYDKTNSIIAFNYKTISNGERYKIIHSEEI